MKSNNKGQLGTGALIMGAITIAVALMITNLVTSNIQTSTEVTTTVTVLNETVANATNTTISYRTRHFALPSFTGLNTSLTFYVNNTIITNVQMLSNGSINVTNTSLNPSCGAYAAPNGRCWVNYTYTYIPHTSAWNASQGGTEFTTQYAGLMPTVGIVIAAMLILGLVGAGIGAFGRR